MPGRFLLGGILGSFLPRVMWHSRFPFPVILALCHRDYTIPGGTVNVAIFDDQLEVISTGLLPAGITVADLKRPHASLPRNSLIAGVFFRRGLIEQWAEARKRSWTGAWRRDNRNRSSRSRQGCGDRLNFRRKVIGRELRNSVGVCAVDETNPAKLPRRHDDSVFSLPGVDIQPERCVSRSGETNALTSGSRATVLRCRGVFWKTLFHWFHMAPSRR
jgi:hypothetical protein